MARRSVIKIKKVQIPPPETPVSVVLNILAGEPEGPEKRSWTPEILRICEKLITIGIYY